MLTVFVDWLRWSSGFKQIIFFNGKFIVRLMEKKISWVVFNYYHISMSRMWTTLALRIEIIRKLELSCVLEITSRDAHDVLSLQWLLWNFHSRDNLNHDLRLINLRHRSYWNICIRIHVLSLFNHTVKEKKNKDIIKMLSLKTHSLLYSPYTKGFM